MIGSTISHYEIVEKLGTGGMGVVYKAHDTKLKRTVALKFLPPQLSTDPEAKERFIHEAQAASALDHPNICTIHEIGETDDGQSYIAMACYDGVSLRDYMADVDDVGARCTVPLRIDDAINIAIQIARGLQKAHEKGIVHRDIKPANIMITEDGTAKVLDFGLAKLAGQTRLTKTGLTMGTAAYMSPEQAKGDPVDQRTDIWSLGVLMYEMLSGKLPFEADYEQAMIYSILNEEPVPVSNLNEDVSQELETIIHKCLTKDVTERYQTIDDLLAEFKGFSKEFDISFDESLPVLLSRFWRKKIVRYTTAAITAILLVILGLVLFWPAVTAPIPIAVISFENQTGESKYDYLSKVIPDLLITNLEQSGRFEVITWQRLRDLLKQLGKDSVKTIDNDLGFEIARLDGVPNLVVGTIAKIGDIFVTDMKILNVETKNIVQAAQAKGNGENSILETQIDELIKEVAINFGEIDESKFDKSQRPITEVTTNSMEAYEYYLLGKEKYDRILFPEARDYFSKAVLLDSTFAMAHLYLAHTYIRFGPYSLTLHHLNIASRYKNKLAHKHRVVFDFLYNWYLNRDVSESARKMKNATKLYPKEKDLFLNLGHYYGDLKGESDSAIVYYKKVLELDPYHIWSLNSVAYTYIDKGDYHKALEYLQKYIDISGPNESNAYDSMGEVYLLMNDYNNSIKMYEKAFQINKNSWPLAKICINYIKMGEYSKARDRLNQELKITRSYNDRMLIHLTIAQSHLAEGSLENTLKEMEFINDLAEQNKDFYNLGKNQLDLSEILFENGKTFEADKKLITVKNLIGNSDLSERRRYILQRKFLWLSCRLAVGTKNFVKAKEYAESFKTVVENNKIPDTQDYHHIKRYFSMLGLIAYANGEYELAIANFLKSNLEFHIRYDNADLSFNKYFLALSYTKTGNKEKSKELLESIIDYIGEVTFADEIIRHHAIKQLSIPGEKIYKN